MQINYETHETKVGLQITNESAQNPWKMEDAGDEEIDADEYGVLNGKW